MASLFLTTSRGVRLRMPTPHNLPKRQNYVTTDTHTNNSITFIKCMQTKYAYWKPLCFWFSLLSLLWQRSTTLDVSADLPWYYYYWTDIVMKQLVDIYQIMICCDEIMNCCVEILHVNFADRSRGRGTSKHWKPGWIWMKMLTQLWSAISRNRMSNLLRWVYCRTLCILYLSFMYCHRLALITLGLLIVLCLIQFEPHFRPGLSDKIISIANIPTNAWRLPRFCGVLLRQIIKAALIVFRLQEIAIIKNYSWTLQMRFR